MQNLHAQCVPSPTNPDTDGDGIANICDLDNDNDGITDLNEHTCQTSYNITANPNPIASESYGGTTATYTELLGTVDLYSFGGFNGFDPSGYPSILRIDYSTNIINYGFRVSDMDNLEKVRILVYDKNNALVPDISSYITYQGTDVLTSVQAGMSILLESTNNGGGLNNSFNSTIYIDFNIPFEVSRIDFDYYDRANGSPEYYFFGGCAVVDYDNDGIPNYLDLDSDNDNCLDALEGSDSLKYSDLNNSGGTVSVGIGSIALNQNFCNSGICVDVNGVPNIVSSSGQTPLNTYNTSSIAFECLVALPIKISNFQTYKSNNNVVLKWKTTNDEFIKTFEIQKSDNNKNWEKIVSITNIGSINYNFTDTNPLNGVNFYKIKLINKDGSFEYSSINKINFNQENQLKIYPIPFNNSINIDNFIDCQSIQLIDIYGRICIDYIVNSSNPFLKISTEEIKPGNYILKVIHNDGSSNLFNIIKSN